MTDRWQVWTLGSEAFRNVMEGGLRSLLLIVGLALSFSGPALVESNVVRSLMERDDSDEARGAYVLVVRSTDDSEVDGQACESLNGQGGIRRAGGVISNDLISVLTAPGTRVRHLIVTPGLPATLRLSAYDDVPSVIVGRDLSDEFGIGVGSFVALPSEFNEAVVAVRGLVSSGTRLDGVERGIIEVRAPLGAVTECYVEVEPSLYKQMRDGALLALAPLTEQTPSISDLLPRGTGITPSESLREHQSWLAPLAGAGSAFVLLQVVRQSRRSEHALYRTTGTSPRDLRLLLLLETLVAAAVALSIASAVFALNSVLAATPRPAVAFGMQAIGLVVVSVVAMDALAATLISASRRTLEQLKDR